MPLAAWVTLLAVALAVAFIALALFRVIVHLRHVSFTLGTVIVGVRAIAHQTRTVPSVIQSVNVNLKPVRDGVEALGR